MRAGFLHAMRRRKKQKARCSICYQENEPQYRYRNESVCGVCNPGFKRVMLAIIREYEEGLSEKRNSNSQS